MVLCVSSSNELEKGLRREMKLGDGQVTDRIVSRMKAHKVGLRKLLKSVQFQQGEK